MSQVSELWQTSDESLVAELCALEVQMRVGFSQMLRLVSELDRRGTAANLGYSNTRALLIHALRIDRADATRRLSQAEALLDTTTPTGAVIPAALPVTAAALERGELGSDHVNAIPKTLNGLDRLNP